MTTKRSDLPSGTCLCAVRYMPMSQHSRQEPEDRVSSKPLRWVPDLVDYIIIIPCLKTDKHKNNQQVAKWSGPLRTSEIRVFTAWEFDLMALQRYFHYHCPFWIQCSIFLSWHREKKTKKPRTNHQTRQELSPPCSWYFCSKWWWSAVSDSSLVWLLPCVLFLKGGSGCQVLEGSAL